MSDGKTCRACGADVELTETGCLPEHQADDWTTCALSGADHAAVADVWQKAFDAGYDDGRAKTIAPDIDARDPRDLAHRIYEELVPGRRLDWEDQYDRDALVRAVERALC